MERGECANYILSEIKIMLYCLIKMTCHSFSGSLISEKHRGYKTKKH